jgi:hypothetical protein
MIGEGAFGWVSQAKLKSTLCNIQNVAVKEFKAGQQTVNT